MSRALAGQLNAIVPPKRPSPGSAFPRGPRLFFLA
jgi:hypothetical protein